MRIAIIDDVFSERKTLRNKLEIQLSKHLLNGEIFEYENGNSFLATAKQQPFTVAFLDIYMDEENGVEVAKKLRCFDLKCILIFVTSSMDHALDGFRVRALQYLVKPYSDQELDLLFNEIIEKSPSLDQYIEFHIVGGTIRLRLQEIVYAEHFQHQIHILTTDGNITVVRQPLREFMKTLNDERFIYCSRGTMINLEYAQDFDGKTFLLANGKQVSVSRNFANVAKQSFGDFLFKRRRS
ncbi:MAG: response regulator transcription factor [Lachnospira sp.]|nr:response regulator transcription factor [Lachnospira sp.]